MPKKYTLPKRSDNTASSSSASATPLVESSQTAPSYRRILKTQYAIQRKNPKTDKAEFKRVSKAIASVRERVLPELKLLSTAELDAELIKAKEALRLLGATKMRQQGSEVIELEAKIEANMLLRVVLNERGTELLKNLSAKNPNEKRASKKDSKNPNERELEKFKKLDKKHIVAIMATLAIEVIGEGEEATINVAIQPQDVSVVRKKEIQQNKQVLDEESILQLGKQFVINKASGLFNILRASRPSMGISEGHPPLDSLNFSAAACGGACGGAEDIAPNLNDRFPIRGYAAAENRSPLGERVSVEVHASVEEQFPLGEYAGIGDQSSFDGYSIGESSFEERASIEEQSSFEGHENAKNWLFLDVFNDSGERRSSFSDQFELQEFANSEDVRFSLTEEALSGRFSDSEENCNNASREVSRETSFNTPRGSGRE